MYRSGCVVAKKKSGRKNLRLNGFYPSRVFVGARTVTLSS
jgi:hypothetical protein